MHSKTIKKYLKHMDRHARRRRRARALAATLASVLTIAILLPLWVLELALRVLEALARIAAESVEWAGANVIPGWLFAKWAENTKNNRDVARIAALRSDKPKEPTK